MTNYVVGFMFSPDEQFVLLIRKNRPAWQAGLLNGIGGKIEDGETPRYAMVREFYEEAGFHTNEEDWEIAGRIEGRESRVYILRTFSENYRHFQSMTDEKISIYLTDAAAMGTVPNLKVIIPALLLADRPSIYLTYTNF